MEHNEYERLSRVARKLGVGDKFREGKTREKWLEQLVSDEVRGTGYSTPEPYITLTARARTLQGPSISGATVPPLGCISFRLQLPISPEAVPCRGC